MDTGGVVPPCREEQQQGEAALHLLALDVQLSEEVILNLQLLSVLCGVKGHSLISCLTN